MKPIVGIVVTTSPTCNLDNVGGKHGGRRRRREEEEERKRRRKKRRRKKISYHYRKALPNNS